MSFDNNNSFAEAGRYSETGRSSGAGHSSESGRTSDACHTSDAVRSSESGHSQETVRSPEGLKLLVTVVNRVKSEYYADLIESLGANMQCFVAAEGTAATARLGIMGLSDERKSVILSVVKASDSDRILEILGEKFKTVRNGKGVAYTVPMTSVISVLAYRFLADMKEPASFFGPSAGNPAQ